MKKCRFCSEPLINPTHRQHYCNATCRHEAKKVRWRLPPIMTPCRHCGTVFNRRHPNGGPLRVYCAPECRVAGEVTRKRELDRALRAAKPKSTRRCLDCKETLNSARARTKAVRCVECQYKRLLALNRASGKKTRAKRKSEPTYDLRDRGGLRETRAEIERFITLTPIENPLPEDPRAALAEALNRHPALRAAFAEHHGIQVGQA